MKHLGFNMVSNGCAACDQILYNIKRRHFNRSPSSSFAGFATVGSPTLFNLQHTGPLLVVECDEGKHMTNTSSAHITGIDKKDRKSVSKPFLIRD
jgi:hypothetical protein